MATTEELTARLAALKTRRDEILNGQNVKSAELDGQRTEFFAPDLPKIRAEISRIENQLGLTPETARRPIGVVW